MTSSNGAPSFQKHFKKFFKIIERNICLRTMFHFHGQRDRRRIRNLNFYKIPKSPTGGTCAIKYQRPVIIQIFKLIFFFPEVSSIEAVHWNESVKCIGLNPKSEPLVLGPRHYSRERKKRRTRIVIQTFNSFWLSLEAARSPKSPRWDLTRVTWHLRRMFSFGI